MQAVTFNTNGMGYWSRAVKTVGIVDMQLGYIDDELDKNGRCEFGELRVYFNTEDWDVNTDGLIYTDKQFMNELREFLDAQGLAGKDVSYSEQGMQGDDYVSCDVGKEFLSSWANKFGIVWADVVKAQQAEFAEQQARWERKVFG